MIAAPSMPWVWGNIAGYSGPYHLVWSRDAYQVATAQLAAGDRGAAERAVDYLFGRQQQPDGCFPQNSNLDGSPHWPNLQLDEVADPIVLSWQLRRFDAGTWSHVKRAADCILANGPASQERWENADGYSPAIDRRRGRRPGLRGRDRRAQRRAGTPRRSTCGGRRAASAASTRGRSRRTGPLSDDPTTCG